MFKKIKNWYEDNKEAVNIAAFCGACVLVGEAYGIYVGKWIMSERMKKACLMNQSFNVDVPKEGVRYLFKFGAEALYK